MEYFQLKRGQYSKNYYIKEKIKKIIKNKKKKSYETPDNLYLFQKYLNQFSQ